MATTSIWRVNGWLGKVLIYIENPDKTETPAAYEKQGMDGKEAQGLSDVIEYAIQQKKTEKAAVDDEDVPVMQRFVSGVNCSPTTARDEMIAVKKRFGKEEGTVAYHGYQSIVGREIPGAGCHPFRQSPPPAQPFCGEHGFVYRRDQISPHRERLL